MNTIRIEYEERWAWIHLNRPDRRNALNTELLKELGMALTELELNGAVRVVIITGEVKHSAPDSILKNCGRCTKRAMRRAWPTRGVMPIC